MHGLLNHSCSYCIFSQISMRSRRVFSHSSARIQMKSAKQDQICKEDCVLNQTELSGQDCSHEIVFKRNMYNVMSKVLPKTLCLLRMTVYVCCFSYTNDRIKKLNISTHLCRMFPILINWASPFSILSFIQIKKNL